MARTQDDKLRQLGAAIGPPTNRGRYALAGYARAQAVILNGGSLLWAQSIHTQLHQGYLRPTTKSDNPLRVKAMIKAIRVLSESSDKVDKKKAADLSGFLRSEWGIDRACEAIGGDDPDEVRELRERWGNAQLPPADALVREISADHLLVEAAVRRLG